MLKCWTRNRRQLKPEASPPEQQVLEVAKIAEELPVVDDVPHLAVVRGKLGALVTAGL